MTLKDRIIKATVRQGTDLNRLYDRISIIGDFSSYNSKFKEIFFKYLKSKIDYANILQRNGNDISQLIDDDEAQKNDNI